MELVTEVPKKVFVGEPVLAGSYSTQRRPFTQKNPYLATIEVSKLALVSCNLVMTDGDKKQTRRT